MSTHKNSYLKNRRIELGLTQYDVASHVGVSEATVSRWESGDIANMKQDRIAALAEILRIEPSYIVGAAALSISEALRRAPGGDDSIPVNILPLPRVKNCRCLARSPAARRFSPMRISKNIFKFLKTFPPASACAVKGIR